MIYWSLTCYSAPGTPGPGRECRTPWSWRGGRGPAYCTGTGPGADSGSRSHRGWSGESWGWGRWRPRGSWPLMEGAWSGAGARSLRTRKTGRAAQLWSLRALLSDRVLRQSSAAGGVHWVGDEMMESRDNCRMTIMLTPLTVLSMTTILAMMVTATVRATVCCLCCPRVTDSGSLSQNVFVCPGRWHG